MSSTPEKICFQNLIDENTFSHPINMAASDARWESVTFGIPKSASNKRKSLYVLASKAMVQYMMGIVTIGHGLTMDIAKSLTIRERMF